jgi:hypothetical protein
MSAAGEYTQRSQGTRRSNRASPGTLLRDSVLVIGASLAARAAFIWFKGAGAVSFDLGVWRTTGALLAAGRNPYLVTQFFVWPPLWVQILFVLQHIGDYLGVSLNWIIPIFLIATESVLIVVLLWLLRDLGYERRRLLMLFGIALNPVCIILVCQHGNFDVLVGLLVLLFVGWLIRFEKSHLSEDWLLACCWLGLGIALKSIPVLLLPMLLSGSRRLAPRVRFLGAVLSLGPTVYGLGLLHVFRAANVRTQILGYRSLPGWFGVTGWFHRIVRDSWVGAYSGLFTSMILVLGIALAAAAYRDKIATPERLVACASLLLVLVIALGPGYGPQYFYWFWPVLLGSFALGSAEFRRLVLGFGLVAAATYTIEYAFAPVLGAFLAMRFPATENFLFGDEPDYLRVFTLLRTPLWLAYLGLLVGLARQLLESGSSPAGVRSRWAASQVRNERSPR